MRQRGMAGAEQQREQQHASRGAEVAAVDTDREDRGRLEQNRGGVPPVACDPCVLRCLPTGSTIASERQPEQERHDLLEALRGCGQQQRGAHRAADRGDRKNPLQPGALALQFGP